MSDATIDKDWGLILAEAKAGVMSKDNICKAYGISRAQLDTKLAGSAVTYGALKHRVDQESKNAIAVVLSDEEIIGATAQRGAAAIKSHLTLTRSLHVRLAILIEGYDELTDNMTVLDEFGDRVVDPKKWMQAAALLDGVSKIAERVTKIEMATFGLVPLSASNSPNANPTKSMDDVGEDELEASLTYQQIMQGTK